MKRRPVADRWEAPAGSLIRTHQTGYGLWWASLETEGGVITAGGLSEWEALYRLRLRAGAEERTVNPCTVPFSTC